MLAPDGVGRTLLSERRVGPEVAVRRLKEIMDEKFPEKNAIVCDRVPEDVEPGTIVLIPDGNRMPGLDEALSRLPPDVIVITSSEICHQVCTVVRVHRRARCRPERPFRKATVTSR